MKSLEALEELKMWATNGFMACMPDKCDELALPIEKELKALEIIKEKEVNMFIFLHSGDLETYNDMVEDNRKLTQEEYNLLNEVLL